MNKPFNHQNPEAPDKLLSEVPGMESSKKAFVAPPGYFDHLSARISEAVSSSSKQSTNHPLKAIVSRKIFWIPLFAVSLLMIAFFVFIPSESRNPGTTTQVVGNSLEETEYDASYDFENTMADLNTTAELMDSLDQGDVIDFVDIEDEAWDVPEEVIVDYLMDQDVDHSLLAEL